MTDDLTDADVLALLRKDERDWYRTAGLGGGSTLLVRAALVRLAAARREAREAACEENEHGK